LDSGHISLRNPHNASTFFLPRNVAPALVKTGADLVEYHVHDASPVLGSQAPHGYAERAIHAAVLKRWSGINAVLHAHDPEVTPWSLVVAEDKAEDVGAHKEHGLAAVTHMSGFLGTSVPVWDIAKAYADPDRASKQEAEKQDMLVRDMPLGASLAKAFGSSNAANSSTSTTNAQDGASIPTSSPLPLHPVVLMRGHGYTSCATSLEILTFQAIYLQQNARVQSRASALACEAGLGKNRIHFLSASEARDATRLSEETTARPWEMWKREVQVNRLYQNELDFESEEGDDAQELERRRRGAKRDSVNSMQSRGYGQGGHMPPVVARAMEKEREGNSLGVGNDVSPGSSRRPSLFEKLLSI